MAKTGWGRLHSETELCSIRQNESPACVGVFLSYRVFSLVIFRCLLLLPPQTIFSIPCRDSTCLRPLSIRPYQNAFYRLSSNPVSFFSLVHLSTSNSEFVNVRHSSRELSPECAKAVKYSSDQERSWDPCLRVPSTYLFVDNRRGSEKLV